jgi:hypothetical protein
MVVFTGRVIEFADATHTVELVASMWPENGGPNPRALVQGAGRTLPVPTSATA